LDNIMARTREVYPTERIAHLWAHQTQATARNPGGNFYFRDSLIFSCRDSFPIAAHVTGKRKADKAILFTTKGYSVTASKHIGFVSKAIPPSVPVFHVPNVLSTREFGRVVKGKWVAYKKPRTSYAHADNIASYKTRINDEIRLAAKAIKYGTRHRNNAERLSSQMMAYAEFFGLKVQAVIIPVDLSELKRDILAADRVAAKKRAERERERQAYRDANELVRAKVWMSKRPEQYAQWDGTLDSARIIAQAVRDAEELAARIKHDAEALARLQAWMNDHVDVAANWDGALLMGRNLKSDWEYANRARAKAEQLAAWLDGKDVPAPTGDTHLRIVGSEVETSRGVVFPVSHARLGLALVKRVMRSGVSWQKNGHTCHLGHYQIDRITVDGTVYAGCHVVPFESIERIASQLEGSSNG
jgi:hypothetical protein